MEIAEGNKLIAEFMGRIEYKYKPPLLIVPNGEFFRETDYNVTDFKNALYHRSWDHLMEVVDKIESIPLSNVIILNAKCSIRHFVVSELDFSYNKLSESNTKKASTWNAVVEFIKWYDKNK